jgi:prophage antirepressor-like protein
VPDLIPFHYESHEIRVQLNANGEPWWVAADIGDALDYPNIANVVKRLDGDEKGIRSVYTPGGLQSLWCVNEAGLYAGPFSFPVQSR